MPSASRPRRRGRRLSATKVRSIIAIGQCWADAEGAAWCVCNIYRKDGQAHIASIKGKRVRARFPTFAELGRDYRLLEGRMARGP